MIRRLVRGAAALVFGAVASVCSGVGDGARTGIDTPMTIATWGNVPPGQRRALSSARELLAWAVVMERWHFAANGAFTVRPELVRERIPPGVTLVLDADAATLLAMAVHVDAKDAACLVFLGRRPRAATRDFASPRREAEIRCSVREGSREDPARGGGR